MEYDELQRVLNDMRKMLDGGPIANQQLMEWCDSHSMIVRVIMRTVNSTSVGLKYPVHSIQRAVHLLGMERITELLVTALSPEHRQDLETSDVKPPHFDELSIVRDGQISSS